MFPEPVFEGDCSSGKPHLKRYTDRECATPDKGFLRAFMTPEGQAELAIVEFPGAIRTEQMCRQRFEQLRPDLKFVSREVERSKGNRHYLLATLLFRNEQVNARVSWSRIDATTVSCKVFLCGNDETGRLHTGICSLIIPSR